MTRGEDPAAVAIRALRNLGWLSQIRQRRFMEVLRPRLPRKGGRPTPVACDTRKTARDRPAGKSPGRARNARCTAF